MIETRYVIGVIAAMGLVTFALRALPFVGAQWLNKHPLVQRLGQFLPLAIMTLLTIHSAAGSAREHAAGPFPELVAIALVAGVIIALAPFARTCCKPGAPFIVSGIIDERENEVRQAVVQAGFSVEQVLHSEFRLPELAPARLLEQMVEAGYLGRKTGRGFRSYR